MKEEKKELLNIGEKFTVELIDITHSGEGVARINNMIVFVEGGLPGDIVEIEIKTVKKSYALGKIVKINTPSPERITPACLYFNACGGCQLCHMSYKGQLESKAKLVSDALQRIGGFTNLKINPILGMDDPKRYRNKAQFKLDKKGMGFYEKKSHSLVHITDCLNQHESTEAVIKTINTLIKDLNLSIYDEKNHKGYIRGILLRTNQNDEVMLTIIVNGKDLSKKDEIINAITTGVPNVKSIYVNINREKNNVILGKKSICVYGNPRLIEKIGSMNFSISPNSFFQVNSKQTEVLYDVIKKMANLTGGETVLDLYCGTGTIGLYLAENAKEVIGIESVGDAVLDARENADLNKIENATFVHGKAEETMLRVMKEGHNKADLIILDPPRKGCDASLLDAIGNQKTPKVIYVSCNPSTLARDLKILTEFNYSIDAIQPVDLFPGTGHVESVVLMSRIEK
ncbi:MAG: 23S rRNA (uracil(1939)-C(5))-methyltransferase RlmD [Eubacteriaceae bacterium]